MKLLIATRCDDKFSEIAQISHPIIQEFANKWGADFVQLTGVADCPSKLGQSHYRIMQFYDLFNQYDRILSLDSDVIITPNCPNIFEEVPVDKIGTIFEDKGTRMKNRHERIRSIQSKFGNIGWEKDYINIGVSLFSKEHKKIFTKIQNKYWNDRGYADPHLGYQIKKFGFPIHELSYKFNHMTMFSEEWNGNANRFNSFIIHYAGAGIFDAKSRIEQMTNDKKTLYS